MSKASLEERIRLRKKQEYVQKHRPLGSGERFKAVMASAKAGGARNPAAVAASIGRKKFGKFFQTLAIRGKKHG